MASTLLSQVIIPEIYESYTAVDSPELTAFFESGVAVRNAALDNAFQYGGTICHMPFWKDLDASVEPNYSTDSPTDVAVPQAVVADEMIARVANLNQGYSAADLVGELAGSNPMQRVRNRFGAYWTKQWQRRVLATAKGLFAANVAGNQAAGCGAANDMLIDLSAGTIAATTDDNRWSRRAFTAAAFTLGDHFGSIGVVAVHSVIYKRMVDNNDIEFVRPAQADTTLPMDTPQGNAYFLGKRVIVDDSMPVIAVGDTYKYITFLFGSGVIGYGEQAAPVPSEVYRRPDQGNGGGVEQLWERKSWAVHPFGYKFLSASLTSGAAGNGVGAGGSAKLADLANAANWTRVVERKVVPLAFLVTNG